METVLKIFRKVEMYREVEGKTIQITVYYQKGGQTYNGQSEKRGYFAMVNPVELKDVGNGVTMTRTMAYSGMKTCLLEVTGKSGFNEKRALEILAERESDMISYVLKNMS